MNVMSYITKAVAYNIENLKGASNSNRHARKAENNSFESHAYIFFPSLTMLFALY